jgi:hypothetical protein
MKGARQLLMRDETGGQGAGGGGGGADGDGHETTLAGDDPVEHEISAEKTALNLIYLIIEVISMYVQRYGCLHERTKAEDGG